MQLIKKAHVSLFYYLNLEVVKAVMLVILTLDLASLFLQPSFAILTVLVFTALRKR